jgi:hypothetical protein
MIEVKSQSSNAPTLRILVACTSVCVGVCFFTSLKMEAAER